MFILFMLQYFIPILIEFITIFDLDCIFTLFQFLKLFSVVNILPDHFILLFLLSLYNLLHLLYNHNISLFDSLDHFIYLLMNCNWTSALINHLLEPLLLFNLIMTINNILKLLLDLVNSHQFIQPYLIILLLFPMFS